MQHLIELEEKSWQAFSSTDEEAKDFYDSHLTDDTMMLFPGGMCLGRKEVVLASIGAQPWSSFRLEEPRVLSLSERSGIVVYKVTAQREGADPYEALISSAYTFDGEAWKMALHQQTPI